MRGVGVRGRKTIALLLYFSLKETKLISRDTASLLAHVFAHFWLKHICKQW